MDMQTRIEHRVLQIIDRAKQNVGMEGSIYEFKADWPTDTRKAARQIGGLANAARGSNIIWIIGFDEGSKSVQDTSAIKQEDWHSQVVREFDGIAPNLICNISIPVDGKTVFALVFDTSRAPFVVKNPAGGPIQFEVPWRQGNSTRSARREDLLRILVPLQATPEWTVLSCTLSERRGSGPVHQGRVTFAVEMDLYVTPRSPERVVIPRHTIRSEFQMLSQGTRPSAHQLGNIFISPRISRTNVHNPKNESLTIQATPDEIIVDGPGLLQFKANTNAASNLYGSSLSFEVRISAIPAWSDSFTSISCIVQPDSPKENDEIARWIFRL